jgi:hypothetical protein
MPHTSLPVTDYIWGLIESCGKTRREIAAETGFPKPNIISMLKSGETKLPLAKIGSFARAVNTDPGHLLRLCLRDYYPEVWASISEFFDESIATHEIQTIKSIRAAFNVPHLGLLTDDERKRLDDFLKALVQAPTVS